MRIPQHRRETTRGGWWAPALLAAALAAAPFLPAPGALAAGADESEENGEESESREGEDGGRDRKKDDGEEPRVFTNEVLKKYRLRARETARGADTLVVDTTARSKEKAPPAAAITPAEKARRKAELQARIDQSEQRLLAIAARRRSLRNPFLPRPELSEEERMASAGKDAVEQLKMLEEEEAQIRARLEKLREEMSALAKLPVQAAGDAGSVSGAADQTPRP